MKGLPMYLVIDKQGNIVKRFTHVTRKELEELLKQSVNAISKSHFLQKVAEMKKKDFGQIRR